MANIAITNICNLKCQYCFAEDMIQEETKNMEISRFIEIINFIETQSNHFGIIGGEPTLHPKFKDFLDISRDWSNKHHGSVTLFTNGIELEKYLNDLGQQIGVLINLNAPDKMEPSKWRKLNKCLNTIYDKGLFREKVTIGVNLYPLRTDYSFAFDILKKYELKHVRTSVVAPSACFASMRNDKEKYYFDMKEIYLNFLKECHKNHICARMDCGHIPFCYFTEDEKQFVEEATCGTCHSDWCHPVIDIKEDFMATACFGSYDPVDIRDFKNLEELSRYLQIKKNLPKAQKNVLFGKCAECEKAKYLKCQGGCLGFAMGDEE